MILSLYNKMYYSTSKASGDFWYLQDFDALINEAPGKLAFVHFNIEVDPDETCLNYAETAGVSLQPFRLLAN